MKENNLNKDEPIINVIYDGEGMFVTGDDEFVYVDFYCSRCMLSFHKDCWEDVKNDFSNMQLGNFNELN